MEADTICLHEIFRFEQKGVDEDGNAFGDFEVCGVRPRLLAKFKAHGVEMSPEAFQRRVLPKPPAKTEGQGDDVAAHPRKGFWR
jgi:pilus assembly protein CpaF